jgi:rubrerythrin
MTRAALLARGTLAVGMTAGAAAAGPWVAAALAQASRGDADILAYALLLEQLEARYYRDGLRRLDLSPSVRAVVEELAANEAEHAAALRDTLSNIGGRAAPPPRLDFGGAYRSERAFLRLAETLEETGVAAYNGAAPLLTSKDILRTAGGIVQVEGRHAAAIRALRGRVEAPRAFDGALGMPAVERRIAPFLA